MRLDDLLVARGLADSSHKAQAMILAGEIFVNGARVNKSGTAIAEDALLEVNSREQKYASRGGFKLEGALRDFHIDPAGRICLDVGSSPAASPIACCSMARCEFTRWTSPWIRSPGNSPGSARRAHRTQRQRTSRQRYS